MSEEPHDGRPPYRTMRELAGDERPRERLLAHGPETLSDGELIAIVLGSGLAGENVMDLARRLLDTLGGLPGLVRADAKALRRTRGLGPAKAAQLAAAIELGRRAGQVAAADRPLLTSPEAVFAHLGARLLGQPQEQLYVLALDTRGRLLGSAIPVRGTINALPIRPAEVFREAMVANAAAVILVHNHPSGDPRPSPQDVASTRSLLGAGELLGVALLDHVIIGDNTFVSMQRESYGFERNGNGSAKAKR